MTFIFLSPAVGLVLAYVLFLALAWLVRWPIAARIGWSWQLTLPAAGEGGGGRLRRHGVAGPRPRRGGAGCRLPRRRAVPA